ncbi:uncharacterized protein LOC120271455 isoform X1 [Dioscorea cayenensis subsp. rotundata]|uniref:Uncharacterized protein LOC120271455 isoform X1 n=1 Tax=Dioscorea cayennensis subsp. rotundata TaxID=55577 RepID=A0AB40C4H6_DIOCR|nr:uncharacterized protein LOC120271455 isoform X1 [Dioscorea cayenensis subsp. rotundata]
MGKGRPRAVEKGVLTHGYATTSATAAAAAPSLPQAPVFFPTEEEFANPLEFISKIRPQAEPFGICRIVPPPSWNPPFVPDRETFSFPTKTQAIHRLQDRPPSCDPKTFHLEYARFLESHFGRRPKRRVVFDGDDLDLCRLFNAVKRYGGYEKVCKEKRWRDVSRFVRSDGKISECAKHVLSQLYLEHLLDYEEYHAQLNSEVKNYKKRVVYEDQRRKVSNSKRRKSSGEERVEGVSRSVFDQICEQCKSGLHGEVMLLCDRCDKGWHLHCLSPPLESVPQGNWYCLECVNSDKDSFGFVPGKWCSLEAFRRRDDRLRRKWFGQGRPARSQVEKRFWDIVEGRAGEVEVMYGSDLDTSVYGSGFPRIGDPIPTTVDHEAWRKYCSSPWNLNNFPKLQGSILRAVRDNIAGVMVPWLYVGMLFSAFCWHVEDHCFYSINYLHWGEPKCWYGVPGSEANAFEEVMRNNLPDLFDAQPDLLFQLITMLNPSVLQENGVSVYGVLQEPGNFVITFPRSYHGGFNFGLNCAEAVNFAPADWLPHGGLGAELYSVYHKPAVLSHEELLYVVAKNGYDAKVWPYLKKEMHRIFAREKRFREELWQNGIVRSSQMSPKKHPEYVGDEEDPTCIICQQFLYLSAVMCSCRPTVHVCLEHWKHLCECDPSRHCLLYRHNLAELSDFVLKGCTLSGSTWKMEDSTPCGKHPMTSSGASSLMKKVKSGVITYAQLAEDWLSNACHILEIPFSNAAYTTALKEAEQFVWADHDMDPVRDVINKLVEVQKWAMRLRGCISQVESFLNCNDKHIEKVCMHEVLDLLSFDPSPCLVPGHDKLKAYAEDGKILVLEIESALSSQVHIGELELLYSRALKLPINLETTGKLAKEISSAKVWIENARECLSQKMPSTVEMNFLHKLKYEMLQLHVRFSEMEELLALCKEVESLQFQCKEIMEGPLEFKKLEVFLRNVENVIVKIPELEILKQYYHDAYSWRCQLHGVLQGIIEQEDHGNIVRELSCILEAGKLLKIRVDELSLVDMELKKSCCREKASKVLSKRMPLEFIQPLLQEASLLGIANEKLFVDISLVLETAISWEDKAKFILEHAAHLSEFDELIRTSENIFLILPSLPQVESAVLEAQSWISRSQPYLSSSVHDGDESGSLLKVDGLQELVIQSKALKVLLDAPEKLQEILKDIYNWKHNSCSLLEDLWSLLYMHDVYIKTNDYLVTIEDLLGKIVSATKVGLSLGYEFEEITKLEHASLTLQWSLKALSFCSRVPSLKEVDSLLEDAGNIVATFEGNTFVKLLVEGLNWLRKACSVIPDCQNSKRHKLVDAEEIVNDIPDAVSSYPLMVVQLQNAIRNHEKWLEQVHSFFRLSGEKSWMLLLELEKHGHICAFSCPELDKVTLEVEKVKKWMFQCQVVVEPLVGDVGSLLIKLTKIRCTLQRAVSIYNSLGGCKTRSFCMCCPNDSEHETFICLTCEDRFHFLCVGPPITTAGMGNEHTCHFCSCMESGKISIKEGCLLVGKGNRPELHSFLELLSAAEGLCAELEEVHLVQDIVKLGLDCKSFLNGRVNQALCHCKKDLRCISESLLCALKVMSVAGVYDHQMGCNLKLALCRNSWKIRVNKQLRASKKPVLQQIQRLLKEGLAINIPAEDHFMQEITEVQARASKWTDAAKRVASDAGALELSEVFNLIKEGEALPVYFDKEMELLKARTVLYCICRKPYDRRAMIACDQCDEWYHFDCINLHGPPPKTYICPACNPLHGDFISPPFLLRQEERRTNCEELLDRPKASKKKQSKRSSCISQQNEQVEVELENIISCYSEINELWRLNRRPHRRRTRKPNNLERLTDYIHFLKCE